MWRLPLVYLVLVGGASAGIVSTREPGPEEVRAVIRATAFTSALPFLLLFTASSLHRLWPSATTRWLMANRRYLGLSVAASHLWHLFAIIAFVTLYLTEPLPRVTLVFGGAGFVFLALMAATSTDAAQRALGRWWDRLHKTGVYVVWLDFIFTYMGPVIHFFSAEGPEAVSWLSPFHTVMTLVFAAAWTLRLVTFGNAHR
jgi:DMSO/TMAO reductase YedYZ heme-binding membrane subunit